ncbi:hypothetical protein MBLNU459_g2585t1 [Dothideomycetes sp. NU459]
MENRDKLLSWIQNKAQRVKDPSPRTPDRSTNFNNADNVERQLQQDGHKTWGWVIYRCTYQSDQEWEEFMKRLKYYINDTLAFENGLDLLESLNYHVFEDRTLFDGTHPSAIRQHFERWTVAAVQDEQGTDSQRYTRSQRYRYCLHVDQDSLRSVIDGPPPPEDNLSDGFVNLVSLDTSIRPELSEGRDERDHCWMRIAYHGLMVSWYSLFRNQAGNAKPTDPVDLEAQLTKVPPCPHWPAFFGQEIASDILLDVELLILSFATGILDATTFAFYSVFVSKQTGNTILLALSALESDAVVQTEPNVAVALSLFIAGSAIFGHAGNWIGQKRRLWLLVTNVIQTALVFAAAALRFWGSDQQRGPFALGVIALLSFACGGQISLALCVRMPELNTTMITGALVQFVVDDKVFHKNNVARNRRVAFYFSMLGGAFVGAIIGRYTSPTLGILLVAVLKLAVTLMFLLNSSSGRKAKDYLISRPEVMVLFGD